jgi:CRISPR-associated endonuclease/helicase Cas3
LPDFTAFFRALWSLDPFPWQSMLAERVADGTWPRALGLPTASGKTACIEIALYALAAQANRATAERTAPRRIWFVVDRRIVVDEAHLRAQAVAEKLREAAHGPLREIADRLRQVAGTERPLAVARLRGGVFRDDGWARLPSQPAVITSTVDQLGSRLLFRGYGHSQLTAPIYAGLAANDSLVLLDEAHCSVPFLQTLTAIETYRGPRWAQAPIPTPFAFAILSATPPPDIAADAIFPGSERTPALDHPVLRARINASKRAELVEVSTKARNAGDPLVDAMVDRGLGYLKEGRQRIALMVNRVRTAETAAPMLREKVAEQADVVLLTGRIRPVERDWLVARWKPYLRAGSPDAPVRPIVLVSTQCLEVGADFSFDALVCEAASLDALRQRFGRLDRMGKAAQSLAVLCIREPDADPSKAGPDPIYGAALARTWALLKDRAESGFVDFGVEALRSCLSDVDDLSPYLAPAEDAPVLLPAHLDLLCQTAPSAHPEPDVQLFLHGKGGGGPEVRVVWRADLPPQDARAWVEIIALCPPVSGEMLSVPLYRLRASLAGAGSGEAMTDVEGVPVRTAEEPTVRIRHCVVWRGRDRSVVASSADEIAPGDVVVLPAAYGISGLGQSAPEQVLGAEALDLWEPALRIAGRPPAARLNRAVLAPWLACPPLSQLVELVDEPMLDSEAIRDAIDAVLEYTPATQDDPAPPPGWWLEVLCSVRTGRTERHPAGGIVRFARASLASSRRAEPDLFADDDDLTSASTQSVTLDDHSELVKRTVDKLAHRCLPEAYRPTLSMAAWWHDVGKLDERFQILLHQGDELAALSSAAPLAKSAQIPTSPARRRAIREASRLPSEFRHEMLSVQLAERHALEREDGAARDLFLHAIASHHGYARPFAPVCLDPHPPAVLGRLGPTEIMLSAEQRARLTPPHRGDSGLTERFWRLVRRHGWWGLAYLEALVRLGDWYASGLILNDETRDETRS